MGCIEGVCRVISICGLMWWKSRMKSSGGVGVFDPERQIPSVCAWYHLAIENVRQGVLGEYVG